MVIRLGAVNMLIDAIIKTLQRVFSPESFISDSVLITPSGRDTLLYTDGQRSITVYSEVQTGRISRLVYADDLLFWEQSGRKTPVTEQERNEIVENIKLYYGRLGETYQIRY